MTALCSVIRNEMEMPSYRVQSSHIIRAVQAYDSTGDVFIAEFSLVCFKSLIK